MTLFLRRPQRIWLCLCHLRLFSTTQPKPISLQLDKNDPESVADTVPAYPYGPARWYTQSDKGLYSGQRIQFGNNVGPKFETKTRRTWQVNVLRKRLWSRALQRHVQVRVSARTLRTIDKVGGLDEYLLGEKEARVKGLGLSGWWLRWAIMQTGAVKKRFREERRRLGLPEMVQEAADAVEVVAEQALEGIAAQPAEKLDAENEIEAEAELDGENSIAGDGATQLAQGLSAAQETDSIPTDNAFIIEQPRNLPPLKFRVEPGKHIVLTERGWIRTRPDDRLARKRLREEILTKTVDPEVYVERRVNVLDQKLKEDQWPSRAERRLAVKEIERREMEGEDVKEELVEAERALKRFKEERTQVLKRAKGEFKREWEGLVEREIDLRLEQSRGRVLERRARKAARKKAEREEAEAEVE